MAGKSFSLHVGINQVNPDHYQGWRGQLHACEHDARFYHALARQAGFTQSRLLFASATSDAEAATTLHLKQTLDGFSRSLTKGDLLLLTYSGHGGLVADTNFDEATMVDQTWCLPDRQLIDDELWLLFRQFRDGVRIVVVSDSCHSGSVVRAGNNDPAEPSMVQAGSSLRQRYAPRNISFNVLKKQASLYHPFLRLPAVAPNRIAASVLLLAACQDEQKASETDQHGLFTQTIKSVLEKAGNRPSYEQLHRQVSQLLPQSQKPNLLGIGSEASALVQTTCFAPIG